MIPRPPRSTLILTLFPYTTLSRSFSMFKVVTPMIWVSPRWNKAERSEEHTSELQSHSEISYAVFCLKKKKLKVYKLLNLARCQFRLTKSHVLPGITERCRRSVQHGTKPNLLWHLCCQPAGHIFT